MTGEVKEPVRVVVRLRPEAATSGKEASSGGSRVCIVTDGGQKVSLLPTSEDASRELASSHPGCAFKLSSSLSMSLGGATRSYAPTARSYTFDKAFGPYSTQQDIYESARPLVESVIRGYNATIFAYGVTGSGKTYTMTGTQKHPGVVPRAVADIFSLIRKVTEARGEQESMFLVWLTYVELYNNKFRNLLEGATTATRRFSSSSSSPSPSSSMTSLPTSHREPAAAHHSMPAAAIGSRASNGNNNSSNQKIEVRESKVAGVFLSGPNLRYGVTSAEEAMELIAAGDRNRAVGSTACNAHSSRSHAVLTFHIESRVSIGGHSEIRVGKLNLVDLAGSERVGLSGAEGGTLVETQNINLSLTCLANVLSALSKNALQSSSSSSVASSIDGSAASFSEGHYLHNSTGGGNQPAPVPYRDSKLTYLLKDSLGGNSKTLMITTLRATEEYYKQTQMSLLYAARAKNIKNRTVINFDVVGESGLNKVSSEIDALKRRLRDRAAELDRLCCGDTREGEDRGRLLKKLEELGSANAREKKELEEKLSKIILNQAGQINQQRQEFTSLQHRLHDQLARYRHTCALQQQEITSLRGTLEALRKTRLCSGASEDEVAEMQAVLSAWQGQATATQQELVRASEQLRVLHSEREAEKEAMEELKSQLAATRANERGLVAEVLSLRTAVEDEKERVSQLASAEDEVGRLRVRLERCERDMEEKQRAMEEMKTSPILVQSQEVLELQEKLRQLENERDSLAVEAENVRQERDEAHRVNKTLLEAADLGDRTSEDIEQEIMEAKVEIGRKEAQLGWVKDELKALEEQVKEAQTMADETRVEVSRFESSCISLAATERDSAMRDLDKTRNDLDESRRAYRALENKFSVSVSDLESRFRVVIEEKEARIRTAESMQKQAEDAYARLQVRLASFQAQLESAKEEAEQVVNEGAGMAEKWRRKAEDLEVRLERASTEERVMVETLAKRDELIKDLEEEVERSRQALSQWQEATSHRSAQETASVQRAVSEALRRREMDYDAEKRVLDGALKAARTREEEGLRMAMEDRDSAVRRVGEWADGKVFEMEAQVQRNMELAVQEERARNARLDEVLLETQNDLARAQLAREALQEGMEQLQREVVEWEARLKDREGFWQEKLVEAEVVRDEERRRHQSELHEAFNSKEKELEESSIEAQRLAADGAAKIREEIKGVYEGLMAAVTKEHEVAMEAMRAELRGARAEAKRLEEGGKDAEGELIRLRRKISALEDERTQERRRWEKEREGIREKYESERTESERRIEEEKEQHVQTAAEAGRLRRAQDREFKARVAELMGLLGGGAAPLLVPAEGSEHWADRLRAKIVAMEGRHASEMKEAKEVARLVGRHVEEYVSWLRASAQCNDAWEPPMQEEDGGPQVWIQGLLEEAKGWVTSIVAARQRAEEVAAAEAERVSMVEEDLRVREHHAHEEWMGCLEEAVARARAEASSELESLTYSMQVKLEEAKEVVEKVKQEKDMCVEAVRKRSEARMRDELDRQGVTLREAMERAVQESEKQHALKLKEAVAEARREETIVHLQREEEWKAALELLKAEAEKQVEAAQARERAETVKALERQEVHTRAFLDKLAREHKEAIREAVVEAERAWAGRNETLAVGRKEEVAALMAEVERRKDDEWGARMREMLAEKERFYANKVKEAKLQCQAMIDEARAGAQLETFRAKEEAVRRVEAEVKEKMIEMEQEVVKAVAEVEKRCREEALRAVTDKREAWEGVLAETRKEVDRVRAREREWQVKLESIVGELEEERSKVIKMEHEVELRAREASAMAWEEGQRKVEDVEDKMRRYADEREAWWKDEIKRVRAAAEAATEAAVAAKVELAIKARHDQWELRRQQDAESEDVEARRRAEARHAQELEALKEAMEWKVREVKEEGRKRLAEARAREEARLEEAVKKERERWEGMAWRSRMAAVQSWRDGGGSESSSAMGEEDIELLLEESLGQAQPHRRGGRGGSKEKALVDSLGGRHKLVARKIKRQAVQKGLLMVANLMSRKGHARVRAALFQWREAAGFKLLDLKRVQLQEAHVIAGLRRLSREKKALRWMVEEASRSMKTELNRFKEGVLMTLLPEVSGKLALSSSSPLSTPLPGPINPHPSGARTKPRMLSPTASPGSRRPMVGAEKETTGVANIEVLTASRREVESALLDGDSSLFSSVWKRWKSSAQAREDEGLSSPLLPWHVALRGYQFHVNVHHLVEVLRAVAALPVDPNELDERGNTALHCVIKMAPPPAMLELLDMVLRAGARVEARTQEGDTATHLVLGLAGKGRLGLRLVGSLVRRLTREGANMNAARLAPPHDTPLSMALAAAGQNLKKDGGGRGGVVGWKRRGLSSCQEQGAGYEAAVEMVAAVLEGRATWDAQWMDAEGRDQATLLAAMAPPASNDKTNQLFTELLVTSARGAGLRVPGWVDKAGSLAE